MTHEKDSSHTDQYQLAGSDDRFAGAITSKFDDKLYPTEVLIHAGEAGLKQDSVVVLEQIRTIDKTRIVKRIGIVSAFTLKRTDTALKIGLGLIL